MEPIRQAIRLWHTVRHLKPVQIAGRIRFHLHRPKPDKSAAPPRRGLRGNWILPAQRRQSQTGPESFRFLNRDGDLSGGWDDPAFEKLWRYNLHYFDDLNASGAPARLQWHAAMVARWIAENPPTGGTGWEPYPTSLRIVNWVKWSLSGNVLSPEVVHSLAVQARWLSRRLEYHLLGNHLFANAKALIFAGCFFTGAEAQGWLERGLRILRKEISQQILADGGHFELSTMYHSLALEDMLDLVNVLRAAGQEAPMLWGAKIAAMRNWLASMSHPDGQIAFFNDAAFGVAPAPAELEAYARRLGYPELPTTNSGCRHFPDSGYVRLQSERAVVLIDTARIGPDYLPGHAHADTLSFELSVDGQRVLVNTGTSVYGTGPERQRQRGTSAHNTVEIEGENSSEVWSGFRVARRALPRGLSIVAEESGRSVSCSHDGYARLPSRPVHRRVWRFGDSGLVVADQVSAIHVEAIALFQFHHELMPLGVGGGVSGELMLAGRVVLRWRVEKGTARMEPTTWHPEFGCSVPSTRLCVRLEGGESLVAFSWTAH